MVHGCCAPCTGSMIESLIYSRISFTLFFFNPNIHPRREYNYRRRHIARFAEKMRVPFVDAGYSPREWFRHIKGFEQEPERGRRCSLCFDLRLERAALYSHTHGYRVFTSSCGISRWKDMAQVTASGLHAAGRFSDVDYWTYNWRKKGGSNRMFEIARQEKFYRQEYCGCIYSFLKTNSLRREKGLAPVEFGKYYYGGDSEPIPSPEHPGMSSSSSDRIARPV